MPSIGQKNWYDVKIGNRKLIENRVQQKHTGSAVCVPCPLCARCAIGALTAKGGGQVLQVV